MANNKEYLVVCTILWPDSTKLALNNNLWSEALQRLSTCLDWTTLKNFGFRITLRSDMRVETKIAFVGPADIKPQMEQFIAAANRYNEVDGTGISLNASRSINFGNNRKPDVVRIQPEYTAFSCSEDSIVYMQLPLDTLVNRILDIGATYNSECAWEFVACPFSPDISDIRKLRHNLVSLESISGIPRDLLDDQINLTSSFQSAAFVYDECIALPGENINNNEITGFLSRELGNSVYARYGPAPDLCEIGQERSNAFNKLRPLTSENRADRTFQEVAGKTTDAHGITGRFREIWAPMTRAKSMQHNIQVKIQKRQQKLSAADRERKPYLFISYARSNEQHMLGFVSAFEDNGIRCWIDREIRVGTEWDTELETRIKDATGIVAIITDEYLKSHMCRQELKYATHLGKKVIPLVENFKALDNGLSFLLSSNQMLTLDDPGIVQKISAFWDSQVP